RVVSMETAAEIVSRLPSGVEPVGVFVNDTLERIRGICRFCQIGIAQLHGDEHPVRIAELSELRVIKGYRVGRDQGLAEVADHLALCRRFGASPWACLIDSRADDRYGGTGEPAPWGMVREQYRIADWPPLILSGGLRAGNVAEAIGKVAPWGVDVASGVESSLACKDPELVRQFVMSARTAR